MKKSSIIVLVLIAVTIGVILASFGSFSTYETFASAAEKPGSTFVVMGTLDKDQAMQYDPKVDANKFVFYAKDQKGKPLRVIFNGTKPQDFERSEQLVMTGFVKDNEFHCEKIQMKCPSKYENDQVVVASKPA